MVEGERPKSLEPCLELTLKLVCHLPPYIRVLNQTFQNPPPQFLSQFLWPVGGVWGAHHTPHPSKIYCDAQAKDMSSTSQKGKLLKYTKYFYLCLVNFLDKIFFNKCLEEIFHNIHHIRHQHLFKVLICKVGSYGANNTNILAIPPSPSPAESI